MSLSSFFPFSMFSHLKQRLDNDLNKTLKALAAHDEKSEYLFWLSKQLPGESLTETKRRVFLNLPKAEGELRLIQLGNAYLLNNLNNIAQKAGVTLFPVYGTLLGCVRHHGFIPWDDDIDIGLFRNDFVKLCDAMKGQSELTLHKYYSPAYVTTLVKVKFVDSETFWVDLWIYDRVKISKDLENTWGLTQKLQRKYYDKLREAMKRYYDIEGRGIRPLRDERIDVETETVEKEMLAQSASWYGVSDGDGVCLSFTFDECYRKNDKVLPCDTILPFKLDGLVFEGEQYASVNEPDERLKAQYGEYLSFPNSISQSHSSEIGELTSTDYQLLKRLGITVS